MLIALLLAQAAPALDLTCGGGGAANRADTATVYGVQNEGNGAWPTMHDKRRDAFSDRVQVRIVGQEGRIRLPAAMLPSGHDGDGWFALSDVKLTERALTGSASVNLMNNPKVHIDRDAGTIRIHGWAGSYDGICETRRS